ncbi:hypothetical protein M758_3G005700 [Ceratodon purpureus]|nr:hypothetical protein M758_3G005700 [Ceratodon purpureus]
MTARPSTAPMQSLVRLENSENNRFNSTAPATTSKPHALKSSPQRHNPSSIHSHIHSPTTSAATLAPHTTCLRIPHTTLPIESRPREKPNAASSPVRERSSLSHNLNYISTLDATLRNAQRTERRCELSW